MYRQRDAQKIIVMPKADHLRAVRSAKNYDIHVYSDNTKETLV